MDNRVPAADSPNHAVSGHGIHFFRVDRKVSLDLFWIETGRAASELKFLLDLGAVYLNSERCLTGVDLEPDDILRVHTEPKRYAMPSTKISAHVVYESENFVVLNKPGGLPVHPTLDNRLENCLSWLIRERGSPHFVTNRIDVGTEGLIAFAKSERAQRIFMKQVQAGRLEKRYSAVCDGPVSVGKLEHWMMPSDYPPKVLSAKANPAWKHCVAEVLETSSCGAQTECMLNLVTGRTHQLRAQLSAVGSPILGDKMYGSQIEFRTKQTWALRSVFLGFRDNDEPIRLELPRWSEDEIRTRIARAD